MINLILVKPDDETNYTKTIIDVSNWRAIGELDENSIVLIAHDCRTYHIQDTPLQKFKQLINASLEMTRTGEFKSIALACPKCLGTGITDWVSDVVGKEQMRGMFEPTFKRDGRRQVYQMNAYVSKIGWKNFYISQASIPEAHQHCNDCLGTGLFMTVIQKDIGEAKLVNFGRI